MNRVRVRVSLLTAIWISVGLILFSVLWAMIAGKSEATGGTAGVGLLLFVTAGAVFAGEVNTAIEAANIRVDDRVRHDTRHDVHLARQDARIAALERLMGIFPAERMPREDAPPGLPAYRPTEDD